MTDQSSVSASPPINSDDLEVLTEESLAAYLFDALVVFRQLSNARGMEFLTYLLDMAAQEANVLSGNEISRVKTAKRKLPNKG